MAVLKHHETSISSMLSFLFQGIDMVDLEYLTMWICSNSNLSPHHLMTAPLVAEQLKILHLQAGLSEKYLQTSIWGQTHTSPQFLTVSHCHWKRAKETDRMK